MCECETASMSLWHLESSAVAEERRASCARVQAQMFFADSACTSTKGLKGLELDAFTDCVKFLARAASLGNLTHLEELDLSHNQLNGYGRSQRVRISYQSLERLMSTCAWHVRHACIAHDCTQFCWQVQEWTKACVVEGPYVSHDSLRGALVECVPCATSQSPPCPL